MVMMLLVVGPDSCGRVASGDSPARRGGLATPPTHPKRRSTRVTSHVRTHLLARLTIVLVLASTGAHAQSVWHLSAPVLAIGETDGSGFGSVAGAVLGANGGVIAADGQALELQFYDRSGRLTARSGRRGEGPGEFRSIRALLRCGGDSAFVYDPVALRISIFAPDGRYVRAIDLRSTGISMPPYDAYCNGGGTLVFVNRSPSPPAAIGPRRPVVELTALSTSGEGLKSLGSFPASERYFTGREDMPRPLGALTLVAAGPSSIHVSWGRGEARGSRVEIRRVRVDGTPTRSATVEIPRTRVTNRQVQAYIEARAEAQRNKSDGARVRALLEALRFPDEFPPLGRMLVGSGGELWLSEYQLPAADSVRWHVIAPDGAPRASMMLPASFDVLDVGEGSLLGTWRDELGVTTLRVHRFGARDRAPAARPARKPRDL